jgi:hypothetical protein
MSSTLRTRVLLGCGVAVAVAVAGVVLWRYRPLPFVVAETPPSPAATVPAPAPPAPSPASAAEPAIRYPIEAAASEPQPAMPALDVQQALVELLGRPAVLKQLQLDELPRRIVATVDNLGRSHAPAALWPVNPTPGRFLVEEHDGTRSISPANAARYAPLVAMVEGLDTERAFELYVRMYPMLQQAYAEIGFPNRYFNDRLVEVIDQLLAAPVPAERLEVRLTEVKGPIPSARPWVRYEFADPALEALTPGQKMLVRLGPAHERRLQAKLAEFRRALTREADAKR